MGRHGLSRRQDRLGDCGELSETPAAALDLLEGEAGKVRRGSLSNVANGLTFARRALLATHYLGSRTRVVSL